MRKKEEKRSVMAASQILILVIGLIAISYAIGSEVREVSGAVDIAEKTRLRTTAFSLNPPTTATPVATVSEPPKGLEPIFEEEFVEEPVTMATAGYSTYSLPGTSREFIKINEKWKEVIGDKIIDADSATSKLLNKAYPGELAKWGIKQGIKAILKNAGTAVLIYSGIKMFGPMIIRDKEAIDAAAKAASIGFMISSSADDLIGIFDKSYGQTVGKFLGTKTIGFVSYGTLIGIGISLAVFYLSYKKTSEQRMVFTCEPWDAPTGGSKCEECNKGILPCTEYQCRSLGQACEIINAGTSDQQCTWKNRNDVNPPEIQTWQDVLLDKNYLYNPDNTVSPPDRGVFIKYKGGCIPAFTPFTFGIKLNEPAKCKIDPMKKDSFDTMQYYFGENSNLRYNHTQIISLPGPESLEAENITLQNDGNYELYVRCQDANGNSNIANFVFKYCVDKGPDTTPPLIVGTNILNNTPIGYNQNSTKIELYVNEPAECRWNYDKDTGFENMNGNMSCSSSVFEMNAQMLYKCSTTLNGLKSREMNKFYFRCKDKPLATKDRNVNIEGYYFVLIGTEPLVIDSVGPEGVVKSSGDSVKVTLEAETSAGYNEGDATCYYSESCYKETGSKTNFVAFDYTEGTSSYTHSQVLRIGIGHYICNIKCIDLGGNSDTKEFEFETELDNSAPIVIRAYHDGDYVKIITDEEAECIYSTTDCNYLFKDGNAMKTEDETNHYIDWDIKRTYYIKCQDEYENQPLPNACSIIVRPVGESE